jgi:Ni,Fe-hydrogenase I large subunit
MKTVEIIERIEGEVKLSCTWRNDFVYDSKIDFLNFRGFEHILEGKSALDALVYTPRICGTCGQSHLKATVDALENIYENINEPLVVTDKAKLLREIGLNIEIINSHIKWFYMFILPDIIKLDTNDLGIYSPLKGSRWLESCKTASETIKALAIIGGQWPHSSYMMPGGVMCDPTLLELTSIQNYMDSAIRFFEKSISGVDFDKYLAFDSINDLNYLGADLRYFKDLSFKYSLEEYGKSYNKFISLGSSSLFVSGKIRQRLVHKLDLSKVKESNEHTFLVEEDIKNNKKHTWSKSVTYNNNFFETGSLSRAMISNRKFIKDVHKSYNDSSFTRILSRMDELAHLLQNTKELIKKIDISEESFIKPKIALKDIGHASGLSVIEASKGSLFHNIEIEDGKIKKYNLITPIVWNFGSENRNEKGIVEKAIIGSPSIEIAKIVLRSFDPCSVCATH